MTNEDKELLATMKRETEEDLAYCKIGFEIDKNIPISAKLFLRLLAYVDRLGEAARWRSMKDEPPKPEDSPIVVICLFEQQVLECNFDGEGDDHFWFLRCTGHVALLNEWSRWRPLGDMPKKEGE